MLIFQTESAVTMPLDASPLPRARLHGDSRLASLGEPARIWAVGSLYGRYGALCQLHEKLAASLRPNDRLVYLGNYLGAHSLWTGEGLAVLNELIAFRNAFIAIPGFFARDIVFLRGHHEDLFEQMLRLPFQRNPAQWLTQMLDQGLESYLVPYGMMQGVCASINQGLIALNHWANGCRRAIAAQAGHAPFFEALNSCATTQYRHMSRQIMLVPTGLDPAYPLHLQYEALLDPALPLAPLKSYPGCSRLVRGALAQNEAQNKAMENSSFNAKAFLLTLDGRAALDGKIMAVCLDPQGQILEQVAF